jgi:hypothetical protein
MDGEKEVVNEENPEVDHTICSKCGKDVINLPDGVYRCGCQSRKDSKEGDPYLDLGEDIRGFV